MIAKIGVAKLVFTIDVDNHDSAVAKAIEGAEKLNLDSRYFMVISANETSTNEWVVEILLGSGLF